MARFKQEKIIQTEDEITEDSSLYILAVDDDTFSLIVTDDSGNRRTLQEVEIDTTFDVSETDKAQNAKNIAEYLGTEPIEGVLGTTLPRTLTDTALQDGYMVSDSSKVATVKTLLKKLHIDFLGIGSIYITVVGSNNIVKSRSNPIALASGLNVIDININLEIGDVPYIEGVLGTGVLASYGENISHVGNFYQRNVANGSIIQGYPNSYSPFYFETESKNPNGVLNDYLTKSEAEGVTIIEPSTDYSTLTNNSPGFFKNTNGYYILKIPFTEDKIVQKITVVSASAGEMNFVVGEIEQAGRFVEKRNFTKNVTVGLNTIEVSEILLVGEYIGIKTPGVIPSYNTVVSNPNYVWATESGYNTSLQFWTFWTPAFQISTKTVEISDDSFVKQSQLSPIEEQINSVSLKAGTVTSPNGSKFKIKVDDNGNLSTEKIGGYKIIGHGGNSILRHPITSYWWGDWGMAASDREFDYNHRFLAMSQVSEPTATTDAMNWAPWELNPHTYNKSNFDTYLESKLFDLFIIRLGENATYDSNYKQDYKDLVLYVQNKLPDARIVIGGLFWANTQKETAMQQVAQELGLTFVSMAGLDTSANKSFIGDVVQGDDNQSHTVDNAGVANHPNDLGMMAIAQRLFVAVNS